MEKVVKKMNKKKTNKPFSSHKTNGQKIESPIPPEHRRTHTVFIMNTLVLFMGLTVSKSSSTELQTCCLRN